VAGKEAKEEPRDARKKPETTTKRKKAVATVQPRRRTPCLEGYC